MTYNPYTPPASASAESRGSRDVRLFGPAAIAAHAVLLTPLIGGIMAAINRHRLGQRGELRQTIFVYVVPSAVLLVVTVIAPDFATGLVRLIGLAWSVAVARALYVQHKPIVSKHLEAGGRKARWYFATLATFGVICAAVGAAFLLDWVQG